ncbi:hypothetical protein HDE_02069 [Halotydeus destructor]|nr:hypothetical protein HDE_02069 [Halotydeus destructor]
MMFKAILLISFVPYIFCRGSFHSYDFRRADIDVDLPSASGDQAVVPHHSPPVESEERQPVQTNFTTEHRQDGPPGDAHDAAPSEHHWQQHSSSSRAEVPFSGPSIPVVAGSKREKASTTIYSYGSDQSDHVQPAHVDTHLDSVGYQAEHNSNHHTDDAHSHGGHFDSKQRAKVHRSKPAHSEPPVAHESQHYEQDYGTSHSSSSSHFDKMADTTAEPVMSTVFSKEIYHTAHDGSGEYGSVANSPHQRVESYSYYLAPGETETNNYFLQADHHHVPSVAQPVTLLRPERGPHAGLRAARTSPHGGQSRGHHRGHLHSVPNTFTHHQDLNFNLPVYDNMGVHESFAQHRYEAHRFPLAGPVPTFAPTRPPVRPIFGHNHYLPYNQFASTFLRPQVYVTPMRFYAPVFTW